MFRLQENVPEIYTKSSRDFQLFCRIYDILNNAIRYSVKSTDYLLNPFLVNDTILPLLATRVGFFPKSEYNTHALRLIISVFPYMMKYKGSKNGIKIALNAILKAENNYGESIIIVSKDDTEDTASIVGDEKVMIYTEFPIKNELLLRDVLSYILPIGYELEIGRYTSYNGDITTQNSVQDYPLQIKTKLTEISKVVGFNELNNGNINFTLNPTIMSNSDITKNTIGSYTVMEVVSADDLEEIDNG